MRQDEHNTNPRTGPFTFGGWLKAQVALLPILGVVAAGAAIYLDAHNDERYVRKAETAELKQSLSSMQKDVSEVKTQQAVRSVQLESINRSLNDLRSSQDNIEAKLDRLIERR